MRMVVVAAAALLLGLSVAQPRPVDVLSATGGLPAHIANQFEEPLGFAEAGTGESVVLDRRAHSVFVINRAKTSARKVIEVGFEKGRVLAPGVLSLSRDDIFAIADAPNGFERIQYFSMSGGLLGGFYLQTRAAPRVTMGSVILSGVGSMSFTGKTFLLNRSEAGALFSELDNTGAVVRHVGTLRRTGYERDPDLHLAMNTGLPLADPLGGYYFVFTTGVPKFQKFDRTGAFLYERHIEGPELDADLKLLPTEWPRREEIDGRRLPLVPPIVRTAAVDSTGQLWISLVTPFTYVYDRRGDKVRTVQFKAAGIIAPNSLSFATGNRVLVTPGCYEFTK